eukprot:TRINITY_DN14905_c0_g2_i1.p1 TRINITY_DN14905_c0_g2~~TRINITY_DN14905_c0_g2_i1.p1  ORF type:complete len:191 (-),score=27.48 TRINITY_DN14905_c0_g2_i1:112-684(-)
MIRRPPRSTLSSSSAASDVYKRQQHGCCVIITMGKRKKKPVEISGPPASTPPPSTAKPVVPSRPGDLCAEADAIFIAADTANGSDGELSHSELKKYLKTHPELKQRLGIESWSACFQEADTDGSGSFSKEEWARFFAHKASGAPDTNEERAAAQETVSEPQEEELAAEATLAEQEPVSYTHLTLPTKRIV